MQVVVNGKPTEVAEGATVSDLLTTMGLGGKWVLVELNGAPVPRAELAATPLAGGDRLELVRAVAGG